MEGKMIVAVALIIQSLFGPKFYPTTTLPSDKSVEYFCEPLQWVEDIHRDNADDLYKGTVEVSCTYLGLTGGGLAALESYMHIKIRNEATTIHTGPVAKTWKNLPATYYDVTMDFVSDQGVTTLRQDVHFANEKNQNLYLETMTKSIDSAGSGDMLKDVATDTWIATTKSAGWLRARVHTRISLEKPWYVPSSMFKSKVKAKIQSTAGHTQLQIVEELAKHS